LQTNYGTHANKDVSLIWDYPDDLPTIETDSGKLKQILQNIIGNAVKFTESGAITTSVRYLTDDKRVEFAVADTGIGIPAEEAPYIFERFHQVDSSQTRSFEGVGLGLYIVKEFTTLLGGKVAVESEPEKGSKFTLTIPVDITESR
jgi:signal transduction histidine kinase